MNDRNTILERLSRRDAERIDKLQKAHKAKEQYDATNENEEYFSGTFKVKSDFIADMLTSVPTLDPQLLPKHFDDIKKEVNDLQKYVVTSSLFLKEFNMRKYLGLVQNLHTKCYELEDQYVPRKKFGFNKKKISKADNHKQSSIDEQDGIGSKAASKWDEKLFGFDNRNNEVLLMNNDELHQRDVTLRQLKNCTIGLKGVLGTLHITDMDTCIILCGPVTTSVFLERCTNCTIVVACQQLRMHSSTKCDIYLHVTSKGIIEDCTEIRTSPYNLCYNELDEHYRESNLDKNVNNWDNLDDFNWLAPDVPSPNWAVLDPNERVDSWKEQWIKTPS